LPLAVAVTVASVDLYRTSSDASLQILVGGMCALTGTKVAGWLKAGKATGGDAAMSASV
jgi:hypothetical protein